MTTRMRVAKIPKEELEKRCSEGTMYADFVPIGKWKWRTKKGIDYCSCSECGSGSWEMEFNFCPFCGADMREDAVDATEN